MLKYFSLSSLPLVSKEPSPHVFRKPSLTFVSHQDSARGVVFLWHFIKSHHDSLAASTRFFHQGIGDALCQLAFLIGRAAGQHGDLNQWHGTPVGSRWPGLLRQFVAREEEA